MISLAGVLFADVVIRVVFGEAFEAAAIPLAILVWAIPVTLLSGHARIALIAGGYQSSVFMSQLAGVVMTVVVGVVTIPFYGAIGGAATTLASYLAVWIASHMLAIRRIAPLPFFEVLRPLGVAMTIGVLREVFAPSSVVAGIAALVAYLILGLLFDRELLADIKQLLARRTPAPLPIKDSGAENR